MTPSYPWSYGNQTKPVLFFLFLTFFFLFASMFVSVAIGNTLTCYTVNKSNDIKDPVCQLCKTSSYRLKHNCITFEGLQNRPIFNKQCIGTKSMPNNISIQRAKIIGQPWSQSESSNNLCLLINLYQYIEVFQWDMSTFINHTNSLTN